MSLVPRRWRAFHTFQAALAGAAMVLLVTMAVAGTLRLRQGDLAPPQTDALLALLYWGTYPLVFVGLGALTWHFVRFYRGDYAAA